MEKDLNYYRGDLIRFKDFIKRYTNYEEDDIPFHALLTTFEMYKEEIKPFDFELRNISNPKKLTLVVNNTKYFEDEEDDNLNF